MAIPDKEFDLLNTKLEQVWSPTKGYLVWSQRMSHAWMAAVKTTSYTGKNDPTSSSWCGSSKLTKDAREESLWRMFLEVSEDLTTELSQQNFLS